MNRKHHADSLNYCYSGTTLTLAGQYVYWLTSGLILLCFDFEDRMEWKDGGEVEKEECHLGCGAV
jgi:hypothetical protein